MSLKMIGKYGHKVFKIKDRVLEEYKRKNSIKPNKFSFTKELGTVLLVTLVAYIWP